MSSWLFILSLLSGLLSFAAFNIGFALEKKVVTDLVIPDHKRLFLILKELIKNKTWLFGFSLTLLSIILYFVALIWAPLSAIAPLAGFGLVILIIYAHVDLQESLKIKEIIGIILVIIGISVSSYFTSLDTTQLTWVEWSILAHTSTGLIVILALIGFTSIMSLILLLRLKKYSTYSYALIAGVAAGIQAIVVKGITTWFSSIESDPKIYVLIIYIAIFLLSALGSTGGLQFAFREGKISTIMALYNGFLTTIPILFGGLVLFEWQNLALSNQIILGTAIAVIIAGIFMLTLEHKHQSSKSNR